MVRIGLLNSVVVGLAVAGFGLSAFGADTIDGTPSSFDEQQPLAWTLAATLRPVDALPRVEAPAVDLERVAQEDAAAEAAGEAPRFAIPNPVSISPLTDGLWEAAAVDQRIWRLRISSAGAVSLNLGFGRYLMPAGGRLFIYSSDGEHLVGPFTEADNEDHGQLWTPIIRSDEVIVELSLPTDAEPRLELELTSINVGYRPFGQTVNPRSGSCNIDVVCPEGDDWRGEIASVGVISTGGSTFCTGFMVNNTAQDQTPYFMTANHCGIGSSNASSLVVYWNFESPVCGQQSGGQLNQYQSGSYFRAAYSTSDMTLVELDDDPNPDWEVAFAGWSRSSVDPPGAVAIHHPNTDEKSISFEYDPTSTTSYLGTSTPGNGSHIRVTDWDLGTTEPGSSGSPLFDLNHRVVGQLHGGYAACGNNLADWYGRFSVSWTGGGSSSTRLSNWLDPLGTGAVFVDTLAPGSASMDVTPLDDLHAIGDPGGPFAPDSVNYTLENPGTEGIDYTVTTPADWISITNGSGFLAGGGSTAVGVSLNANALALAIGPHAATVTFTNLTNNIGDTTREVTVQVGIPDMIYEFPLDSDPGWETEGQWEYGPATSGGTHSGDPGTAYSGTNIFGYNLGGDYLNLMQPYYLTTNALDCSNLADVELRFRRWLGVEGYVGYEVDRASIEVSLDGENFTTVWENAGIVDDDEWQQMVVDLSGYADDQPEVYVRWGMGPTDFNVTYPGWNLDDVEIWGIAAVPMSCSDGIKNQGESMIDCGGLKCAPCECLVDSICINDSFCDGTEYCNDYGQCKTGSEPCDAQSWCDDQHDQCTAYGDGDFDGDSDVDLDDFRVFQTCFDNMAFDACEAGNLSGDGTIDLADWTQFITGMMPPG